MKYETPQLTALMPAINAVQSTDGHSKSTDTDILDTMTEVRNDLSSPGYLDWED
jgi:hypothetical protein